MFGVAGSDNVEDPVLEQLDQLILARGKGVISFDLDMQQQTLAHVTDQTAVQQMDRPKPKGLMVKPFGIDSDLPPDVEGLFVLSAIGVMSHSFALSLGLGALNTVLAPLEAHVERSRHLELSRHAGSPDEHLPSDLILYGQTLQSIVSLSSITSSPGASARSPLFPLGSLSSLSAH